MAEYTYDISRESQAQVKLTIHVPAETVKQTYEANVKEISAKAQIKGFRKGKAPIEVLELKFGESLRADATEKIIQNALKELLDKVEHKPLPYSMPQFDVDENSDPKSLIIDPSQSFSFTITYDTEPDVEPADISSLTLETHEINITDDDLKDELTQIQERNAITVDKTEAIANGDLVTYSFVELEENNDEISETKREDYTVTVGETHSLYHLEEDIIGMKTGEEKTITKVYEKDFHHEELAGKTCKIKINIGKVRRKDLPEIDDELAQDVNADFKTLDDLKKHLSTQLKDRAQNIIEQLHKKQMMDYLIKHSNLEIPQSAIALQQNSVWNNFVQQYGGNEDAILKGLKSSGTTKEKLLEMWYEESKNQVAGHLVINALMDSQKIEMTDDMVTQSIKEECEKMGHDFNEVIEYYKQNNYMSQIAYDLKEKKLFENLKKVTIIQKGKEFTYQELLEYKKSIEEPKQENDNHEHAE